MVNVLNLDGTLNKNAGPYVGQTVEESRRNVVADMERQGLLLRVEDRVIDLAHSDRSKEPIEPLLTDQWFVHMGHLAQTAIDAAADGRVKIVPARYTKGYVDWLSEKRDWPISRQLWWGHQIPVWYSSTASEDDLEAAFGGRDGVVWRWDEERRQWLICAREEDLADDAVPGHALRREEDVLDTWFSSALWPHSTLGWPQDSEDLKYYYPTSTLITSRDIITLWVARMVLAGLYNVGEIPFHEVYIHPKILDGYGEGMSKSKGNGVDPLDVMEKFGADSLRFGLAHLTTETQDVRMPVDFECPHCNTLVTQTRDNRTRPRVTCSKCRNDFSTQWAESPEDKALLRGAVISDRFEVARNFCNKLWNASRFALMNLDGYTAGAVTDDELLVEDRWILSRLSTVTGQVTEALADYRYADAARTLKEFSWDEFCSFYVEMVKARLQEPTTRPAAQRVLVHTLDALLRLLHPMIPFLTEEVWQRLGEAAPERGLDRARPAAESVMIAPWPEPNPAREDARIEAQFTEFQQVLRAVREIRSRQNVAPRQQIEFMVRSSAAAAELLRPMEPYFASMAAARPVAIGPDVEAPTLCDNVTLPGIEVYVDLGDLIDVEAEVERKRKKVEKLDSLIAAKTKKLANKSFLERAPEAVVAKERASLEDLRQQRSSASAVLERMLTLQTRQGP
jgi:valyl-tRNA synthetase